ncbi:glycosyltransferase family 4 protein [Microbaculum marinisediminis]|nr:glycosyltransferase family 4 protein [Microbaculum sp. A6E488]
MNIAFYAPMKPPDDPVISGDRETARLILKALAAEGHRVEIASRLRTWQRTPDEARFVELKTEADVEVRSLLAAWAGHEAPDLWITYHLYHKAPDWIGPAVSAALAIPYVVIEGCRAAKHAAGPWATGFAQADRALTAADAVAAMHAEDAEGLMPLLEPGRLFRLKPFIDAARFEAAAGRARAGEPPVLVAVAMMRAGDKEASYRLLAAALERLERRDWRLLIAGDGARRDEILALFPPDRIDWRGAIAPEDIAGVYAEGDLFVWPAINEAFGIALLEAQAAGLPVIAGASGGVPDIVRDGETGLLVAEGDEAAFAAAVARLLDDADTRRAYGKEAAAHVRADHDIAPARRAIGQILEAAVRTNASRRSVAAGAA